MDKKQLHHFWVRIRPIKPWYFLIIALISGVVAVAALRQNDLAMIKLRQAVVTADQQNGDVETALRNLREYVYGHMNTNLASGNNAIRPPIQLKYRYERLVQAEKNRVAAINAKVYTEAQAVCEQQIPSGLSGGGRVPCIQQYVTAHGTRAQPIPDALYKFDFLSPAWSPDLAGWSLVFSSLSLVLYVITLGVDRWVKAELKT